MLFLTVLQYFASEKEKIQSDAKLNSVTTNQINLQKTFNSKETDLENSLNAFRKEQQEIVSQLATNKFYDPDLRQKIITTQENLNQLSTKADNFMDWMDGLKASLRDKRASVEIEQEKNQRESAKQIMANYTNGYAMFRDAVSVFTNLVYKAADLSGDNVVSTYTGLPDFHNIGDPNIMQLGTIRLQTNSSCNFEIHLIWAASSGGCQLGIHGNGASFDIRTSGVGIYTMPPAPEEYFNFPTTNYSQIFVQRFGFLLANCDIKPVSK